MSFENSKNKTREKFEIIFGKLEECKRRLDRNDSSFNWSEIQFSGSDFGIDKIKNRFSDELHLSDVDVYRILKILFEEWQRLEEIEA